MLTTTTASSNKSKLRCYNCGELSYILLKYIKLKRAPTKEVEPYKATTSNLNAEADTEDTPLELNLEN